MDTTQEYEEMSPMESTDGPIETTKLVRSKAVTAAEQLHDPNQEAHERERVGDDENILSDILTTGASHSSPYRPNFVLHNFILLSVLFSANHGAVVSCLSLSTAKLGDLGNWQSSVLYLFYTLSALFGATYVVKSMGPRRTITIGMWIYCVYVACFAIATIFPTVKKAAALTGAAVGGIGGGFLWTAQGSYFARAAEEYAVASSSSLENSTAFFGGIFAGIYLTEEVAMRLLSTVMLRWGFSWIAVFVGYTMVAIGAAFLMIFVPNYPISEVEKRRNDSQSTFYKATVTFRLFLSDPKMKYMAALIAPFSLVSVFVASFVNGEVVRVALSDSNSTYIGLLTSISAAVGGGMSIVFGLVSGKIGNGSILVIGTSSFFAIAVLFLTNPNLENWNIYSLALVYVLQGIGRATFEGALKAEFALVFQDKEAAFGNISMQNGILTSIGYVLASSIHCPKEGTYCVEFSDHRLHNVLVFELLIVACSVIAVTGYHRAKSLYNREREEIEMEARLLGEDHLL